MTALKRFWMAGVAAVLLAGVATAQQPASGNAAPLRAVYVTGQDGSPKIYYVTGTVPPEKLPTVAPAAPTSIPPIPPRVTQAKRDVPAQLPDTHVAAADPAPAADANCPTGHCGTKCKHGPTSFCVCACTPATIVPPLGSSVRDAFGMQRDNALAEYFVIYREDWIAGDAVLNASGVRHADGVARRFATISAPVKVEPSGNAELDRKRLTAVVEKLVQAGVPPQTAGGRVVLGTTRAEGLRNGDIESIYQRGGLGGTGLGSFGSGGLGYGGGFGVVGGFGGIGGGFGYYR